MTTGNEDQIRDAAELLSLDFGKLSAGGRLKCELVAALRACVDDQLTRVTRGSATDIGKLVAAVEQLTAMMKQSPAGDQEIEDDDGTDPHENLMRIIENWVEGDKAEQTELAAERLAAGLSAPVADLKSAQARIDELEGRLAEFEPGNSPKVLPPPVEKVITPSIGDIVSPGEQGKLYVGPPPRTPDDIKAMRPKPVIEGKAEPVPSAPAASYDYSREQSWKNFVNVDGSIRSTPRGRWDF